MEYAEGRAVKSSVYMAVICQNRRKSVLGSCIEK